MRDSRLRRLVAAHVLAVTAEWAVIVGLLTHAFSQGGSGAVGVVSIAVSLAPLVFTPLLGMALARWRPLTVRIAAFAVQSVAYSLAAVSVVAGAAWPLAAVFVLVGLAGMTCVHPSGAALLPRVARSTGDLVSATLWVTYCDNASALVGSLTAGVAVGAGGPEVAFFVGGLEATIGLAATLWRPAPLARTMSGGGAITPRRVLRGAFVELRAHPWSRGVLGVSSARNLVVGAFNTLLVVMAIDALRLGDGGPGYLNALVGAGALASTLVVRSVVRRSRLRGALMAAIALAATLSVVLGATTDAPVVYVALPIMGACIGSMDALSRTLLQRSSDPRNLGSLTAALGFVAGFGQLVGSVLAQVGVAFGGLRAALIGLGALLIALAILSVNSLRRADLHADVPVMEMALLSGLPMFASLPSAGLERVARSAEIISVVPDESIMIEGEPGEACFVIVDGEFEATAKGTHQRAAARGDVVGEVALLTQIPETSTMTARTLGSVLRIERNAFLVALTGHDLKTDDVQEYSSARARYRDVVSAHERDTASDSPRRADAWLGLGAAGRMLGDPTYAKALARGASLAKSLGDEALLAQAAAMATWPGAFFFIADNPDQEVIGLCEGALVTLSDRDPIRVRVLATLASHLTFTPERARRVALIREARELAAHHDDPALIGAVLNAEFICLWEPETLERRQQIAMEITAIASPIGDAELEFIGGFFTAYCEAEFGRFVEAREQLVGLRTVLPRTRHQYFEFLCERLILSIDIARGEPDVTQRIDALAHRHANTSADADGTWALQTGFLAYQTGTVGSLVPMITEMMTDGPLARIWRTALALAQMVNGETAASIRTVNEFGELPKNYFWLSVTQGQAEVAASLGLLDRCEKLFEELSPFRGRVGITASGSMCFGLVSRSLGELALALERYDRAIELLTEATRHADKIGMRFEAVLTRRLLATALLVQGDERAASNLIDEALQSAHEQGFAREVQLLSTLR